MNLGKLISFIFLSITIFFIITVAFAPVYVGLWFVFQLFVYVWQHTSDLVIIGWGIFAGVLSLISAYVNIFKD